MLCNTMQDKGALLCYARLLVVIAGELFLVVISLDSTWALSVCYTVFVPTVKCSILSSCF